MSELTYEALADIQGLILSGYAHLRFASYLFLDFRSTVGAKAWLKAIIAQITTAKPWEEVEVEEGGSKTTKKRKPPTALNIAFSLSGFKALGLPNEALDTFSTEFISGITSYSEALGDTG